MFPWDVLLYREIQAQQLAVKLRAERGFLFMNYCYTNLPVVQRDQYAKWWQVGCLQNKYVQNQSAEKMTSPDARQA